MLKTEILKKIKNLEIVKNEAIKNAHYERAAQIRDMITKLKSDLEKPNQK